MKTTRISQALLVAVIGSAALIGCKKKEEPAPAAPAPAPAATEPAPMAMPAATASVTAVTLGNAVGADGKVAAPSASFAKADTIYAVVETQTSDATASVPGKLSAKWTHVDSSQVITEESKDFAFTGPGTTTFQISKPDGWPTGKYKVEISLDGAVVNTTDFEVK